MANRLLLLSLLLGLLGLVTGCAEEEGPRLNLKKKGREVPEFSADSAYGFVEKQLSFGPRNPGSEGHQETEEYLVKALRSYAGSSLVFRQSFSVEGYSGDTLRLTNIVASFNPEHTERIMFSAHWDTRPRADQDSVRQDEPIMGADDGASGVAVLLELARLFHNYPPPVGVDIVLFDGEDYGREGDTGRYFLGSRYWSEHPPVKGYAPRFGILLDMVGGRGAQFPKEQYSLQYAPALVNEIWAIAQEQSADPFIDQKGSAISDDHVVINRITGIPTIDIVRQNTGSGESSFAPYWHTHSDNLEIIDKSTLEMVGNVLTELIYNRL